MENKLSSIAHCLNKSSKGPYSQSYGFSSRHVWIRELDHKEGWAPKNWYVQIVVLEKNLESPLDSKEIKPVNPEGVREWKSLSHFPLCDPMDCSTASLPCPSLSPGACSNSCPLSQWWHPTISSSVIPFSSCLQSFPPSGSFLMSQLFTAGSQSTRASASASVLPVNIQDLFPLGLTGFILLSKGLSRVFSTTVQEHQFFGAQPSLWSNSHIHTWPQEKP